MTEETTQPPLRVAWLAGPRTLGDLREVLLPTAEALGPWGVEVVLLVPAGCGAGDVGDAAADVVSYPMPRWHTRRLLATLAGKVASAGTSVLHALDASVEPLGAGVASEIPLPWLVTCTRRGGKHLSTISPEPLLLALSEPIRADLLGSRKIGAGQVRLWRPGVHVTEEPKNLAFNDRDVAVLADAEGASQPMLLALLHSFAELHRRRSDCLLFFVEASGRERFLRRQASRLGVARWLTFVSQTQARARAQIIQAADVYVSLSESNRLDLGTLVAMAGGVPVVTPADGSEDFLQADKTATLFDPADPHDLAEKLSSILSEGDQTDWQAEKALRYVREHHDPQRQAGELAGLYRNRRLKVRRES